MMTSSNGDIFRVTGHLCGEFTGTRTHYPGIMGRDVNILITKMVCECLMRSLKQVFPQGVQLHHPNDTGIQDHHHQHGRRPKHSLSHSLQLWYTVYNLREGPFPEASSLSGGNLRDVVGIYTHLQITHGASCWPWYCDWPWRIADVILCDVA